MQGVRGRLTDRGGPEEDFPGGRGGERGGGRGALLLRTGTFGGRMPPGPGLPPAPLTEQTEVSRVGPVVPGGPGLLDKGQYSQKLNRPASLKRPAELH